MADFYNTGTHRIVYQATSFGTGETVTAYIWNPSLVKSSQQTFIEIADGLYYLDYNFTVEGTHIILMYEGGTKKSSTPLRVKSITDLAYAALNTAFTDATSLTSNGLLARIRKLMWIIRNKMAVTNANGNTVIYKDDDATEAINVNAALTDNDTTTTRKRLD